MALNCWMICQQFLIKDVEGNVHIIISWTQLKRLVSITRGSQSVDQVKKP
jgi:hypothetical protein